MMLQVNESDWKMLRNLHEITCTSCLSESYPAALSSVNVPRHASLLYAVWLRTRLAWTNSS